MKSDVTQISIMMELLQLHFDNLIKHLKTAEYSDVTQLALTLHVSVQLDYHIKHKYWTGTQQILNIK